MEKEYNINANSIKAELNSEVIIENHNFNNIEKIKDCFKSFPNKKINFMYCDFIGIDFKKLYKIKNHNSISLNYCGLIDCKGVIL
jgi:hypothetical protein